MKLIIVISVVAAVVLGLKIFKSVRRRQKRRALLSTPFPAEWAAILKRNFPLYEKIPPLLKQQLNDNIRIFISEKSFEGCGGLTLTDEMRVTIAAQACMLLLNRKVDCYPKLFSILLYPGAYVTGTQSRFGSNSTDSSVRLGESWTHGTVVLAWDSVKNGVLNFQDGHNVAMHEFAHQLDQEDGSADGAPVLKVRSAYSTWSRTFSKEYELLRKKASKRKKSVMHKYGATNPAEFFAVATETFFEKPEQLKKKHAELYHELESFYKVDPVAWNEE
ncbi:MAG: zinc-dependent peptidase [Deltaproteobacteria bacterium]|nr:zinc-dependent peptidase [Deltaproteobacteria bacterium]